MNKSNSLLLLAFAFFLSFPAVAADNSAKREMLQTSISDSQLVFKGLNAKQVCSCVCGKAEKHNLKLVDNCARTYSGKACRLSRGVDSTYNGTTCKQIYVTD